MTRNKFYRSNEIHPINKAVFSLFKAGQEKGCKSLIGWTRHVVNHFWYAAQQSSSYSQFIVSNH